MDRIRHGAVFELGSRGSGSEYHPQQLSSCATRPLRQISPVWDTKLKKLVTKLPIGDRPEVEVGNSTTREKIAPLVV